MSTVKEAAAEFLARKRVAVTGVSRKPQDHGSNVVYRRLRERGYDVFAVNPNAHQVEGDRCFPDLKSIPGGVDAVVIATRPEIAEATVRECAARSPGEFPEPELLMQSRREVKDGTKSLAGVRRSLFTALRRDRRTGRNAI